MNNLFDDTEESIYKLWYFKKFDLLISGCLKENLYQYNFRHIAL